MNSGSVKCNIQTTHLQIMYELNLALDNLQGLICHKARLTNQNTFASHWFYLVKAKIQISFTLCIVTGHLDQTQKKQMEENISATHIFVITLST